MKKPQLMSNIIYNILNEEEEWKIALNTTRVEKLRWINDGNKVGRSVICESLHCVSR